MGGPYGFENHGIWYLDWLQGCWSIVWCSSYLMVFIKDLSRLEYVWIDADGELRSKSKTIRNENHRTLTLQDVTVWNFDGSSTDQAPGHSSECLLQPVRCYNDGSNTVYVLCDCI